MARPFKPLPLHVFPEEQRPYIARLNQDLDDLFRLEGVLRNPTNTSRSDRSIVRRSDTTVDVSRISPPIANVVSGASTVVGVPSLTLSTSNLAGTTTTAIATNSTIALFGTQAPSDLATVSAVGTSAFAARADHVHEFGESLATASDRTDMVTLTDDATEGALLAASNAYAVNGLALKAPNATNTLRVGKYGNLALAGTALDDTILMRMSKTDYSEINPSTPTGLNLTLTNTNTGSTAVGGFAAQGFVTTVTASMANAGVSTTNIVLGGAITATGGAAGNSRFWGTVRCLQLTPNVNSSVTGTSVVLVEGIRVGTAAIGGVVLRSAVTDYVGYRMNTPSVTLGSIANLYGVLCDSLTSGSSRISYMAAGAGTGTPTIAYGFRSSSHSVGTTRRGLMSDNSNEATAGDWICSSSSRGLVTKDTQGTARYWRSGNSASGTSGGSIRIDVNGFMYVSRETGSTGDLDWQMVDVGTAVPAA